MAKIEIKPEQLERTALKLSEAVSDIRGSASGMDRVKDSVEAGWQSRYTGLYTSEIQILKNNLNKIADHTEDISRQLRETAAQIRQTEEKNRAMFSGRNR